MAEKENKKRKRQSNGVDPPNKKLTSTGAKHGEIEVHVNGNSGLYPVLLSSPGLSAPRIPFKAFSKLVANRGSNEAVSASNKYDVLLHSSEHPRVDYTATRTSLDQNLSHYVAVFDPSGENLEIIPAHNLSLRSILRSEAKEETGSRRRTITQQRAELGRVFGTKKAKKAIADRTVNAIGQGAPGKGKGKVQDAILESMAESALPTLTEKEQIEAALAAKPIPRPNLEATEIENVYPFDNLVPDEEAHLVTIKDWQDNARADIKMEFKHLYPACRVGPLGKGDDILRLKALRYLSLVLEFHDALTGAGRSGKKVPKRQTLKERLQAWPDNLIDAVRLRFANQQNELPKWHMDNLYTHICALALFIDGWTTDVTHLRQALKMENKEIVRYFRELGCKVAPPTEKERGSVNHWWGGRPMTKEVAASTRVAKLVVPPDFPKARSGRRV